ncbi:hypothetical protein [Paracidovorax cattleyae]|uniref:hypothetical protein n=1 Tax=Paracidovorax cattleyae TaxID=80868 RepID=UPI001CEFA668|nr:hypothetical protein [Paracidovorax cattleyae]
MPRQQPATNPDGTCHDDVLLHQLGARIDAMQGDALIVLHQLGGAYRQDARHDHRPAAAPCG